MSSNSSGIDEHKTYCRTDWRPDEETGMRKISGWAGRAMLGMIDQGTTAESHPANWGPFVLVGEGGAGR